MRRELTMAFAKKATIEKLHKEISEAVIRLKGARAGKEITIHEILFEVCMQTVSHTDLLEWAVGWGYGTGEELYDELTTNQGWPAEKAQKLIDLLNEVE